MDFIVKSVGTTYRNWNFHDVDSPIDSYLYMTVVPYGNARLDLGEDYVLCSYEYFEKQAKKEGRDEQFAKRVPTEVSLAFYNYDKLGDDRKKDLKGSCGTLHHDMAHVGITVYLRDDVFNEVKKNISLNKRITSLSVDFKKFNEKDAVEFGASSDGSHSIWMKENNESNRLEVDSYDISFRLYESPDAISYEEREDEELRKQRVLMNTIENAILYANEKTKVDFGVRLFNELKPYLIAIVVLLTAATLKLII